MLLRYLKKIFYNSVAELRIIKKDVASFENEETGRRWELCMAPYVLEESNCDD